MKSTWNFFLTFLAIFLFYQTLLGQTVLLYESRNNENLITESGQNLKRFSHIYIRTAFITPKDNPGARIIYGSSLNLAAGVRKKYKIGSVYSLGFDIEAQFTDYKLKQSAGKVLPDTILHDVSRMDYTSLGFGFYNRFNFDPHRGNFMGTFFDLGVIGTFHYSINSISKTKLPDGTKLKSITSNLKYVNNTDARAYARLGFSHVCIYGSYRLTDLFKKTGDYPELPKLIVGLELGLY